MKICRKTLVLALLLVFSASLLFAGGSGETKESKEKTSTEKMTTISYYFFPDFINVPGYEDKSTDYGVWEDFITGEFEKANPNVDIEPQLLSWDGGVDKLNVMIAGGNPPDLLLDFLGRTGGWFRQGAIVPLDNLLSKKLQNDLLPAFKSIFTIEGNLHGMPVNAWTNGLIINKGLAERYGVLQYLPKRGEEWTVKEFENACEEIKKAAGADGKYPFALASGDHQGDYNWWKFIWGQGGKLYDDNGNIAYDSKENIAAHKWFLNLLEKEYMVPGVGAMPNNDVWKYWSSEKIFMAVGSGNQRNFLEKAYKEGVIENEPEVYIAHVPTLPGITPKMAFGPKSYVIMSKDNEKQEIAADFIEFVFTEKDYYPSMVKSTGRFPSTKTVSDMNILKGDPLGEMLGQMLAEYPAGDFGLADPDYGKMRVEFATAQQEIFTNIKTPAEALSDLQDRIEVLKGIK